MANKQRVDNEKTGLLLTVSPFGTEPQARRNQQSQATIYRAWGCTGSVTQTRQTITIIIYRTALKIRIRTWIGLRKGHFRQAGHKKQQAGRTNYLFQKKHHD